MRVLLVILGEPKMRWRMSGLLHSWDMLGRKTLKRIPGGWYFSQKEKKNVFHWTKRIHILISLPNRFDRDWSAIHFWSNQFLKFHSAPGSCQIAIYASMNFISSYSYQFEYCDVVLTQWCKTISTFVSCSIDMTIVVVSTVSSHNNNSKYDCSGNYS